MVMMLICAVSLNAQELLGTYKSSYFSGENEFTVEYSIENGSLYLAGAGETPNSKSGLIINKNQRSTFISNLTEIQKKYNEWVNIAKSNNVNDISKDFVIVDQNFKGYWLSYSRDWHFDSSVKPTYKFRVLESKNGDIKYLIIINSGELESSSNRYMTYDQVLIVFSSSEEIQNLINLISDESIENLKNKQTSTDSLFE